MALGSVVFCQFVLCLHALYKPQTAQIQNCVIRIDSTDDKTVYLVEMIAVRVRF